MGGKLHRSVDCFQCVVHVTVGNEVADQAAGWMTAWVGEDTRFCASRLWVLSTSYFDGTGVLPSGPNQPESETDCVPPSSATAKNAHPLRIHYVVCDITIRFRLTSIVRRSITSSKASSPRIAIRCFLFHFPVSTCFPNVMWEQITSSSSSSDPVYLSFNNLFQKALPTQYVTVLRFVVSRMLLSSVAFI
jgi:hypothetical protein